MRAGKITLALLVAAVALGACVGGASAGRLSFSNGPFRAVFGEPVGEPPLHAIWCAATLEGSLHSRTMVKTANALIGYVTNATIREETCRGGRLRFLRETLPWHLQYEGFSGALPNITAIAARLVGMAALAEFRSFPGSSCLIRTTATEPEHIIFPREAGGGLLFRLDETRFIRTTGLCPETLLGFFGTTPLRAAGTETVITLRLI